MAEFIYNASPTTAGEYISTVINAALEAGKKVLWLSAGGSSIPVAVAASKLIRSSHPDLLSFTLTDERYEPIGHKDSNWQGLLDAGFLLQNATIHPVIQGDDIDKTTTIFNHFLANAMNNVDVIIGLFGIGADCHTAGLLPHCTALESHKLADHYAGHDFKRITITPKMIAKVSEAILYANGESKWPALASLQHDAPHNEQPAQLLKQVPKFTVYSDYKGVNT